MKYQSKRLIKGKILKPSENCHGYLFVTLQKENNQKIKTIHRLVAETFNYQQINHIDGNKQNNRIDNLEWCTQKYNIQEAWRMGLAKQGKGELHPESRAVNQYDLNGNLIKRWGSMMDIQRELGFFTSCICACCKKKYATAYGYVWRYA